MSTRLGRLGAVAAGVGIAALTACASGRTTSLPPAPRLEVDSAEYHVVISDRSARVTIPFRFVNGPDVASQNYCIDPPSPMLEKKENGSWVTAIATVSLMCLAQPPFRIPRDSTYNGVIRANGGMRGSNVAPQWSVVDFPGQYRLHWVLAAGPDPDRQNGSTIDVVSPTFTMSVVR